MNHNDFLKEKESRIKEQRRLEEIRRFNQIRNNIIKGSKKYDYEYSKEFYLIEPHDNDLYVQN